MIGKVLVLSGLGVSLVGVTQGDGFSGLSFLTQSVKNPLWFVLLLGMVPTGETLRVIRGYIRHLSPGKPDNTDSS